MKTSLIVTLAATSVAIVGLIAFLAYNDKDVSSLLTALPVVATTLGVLFGLNKVSKTVDTVKSQTNGTLSAMRAEAAAKDAEISQLRSLLTPTQAASVPLAPHYPTASETVQAPASV